MIIYRDVIQGTSEWAHLRAGIPTASAFDNILTPAGKPSKSVERYLFTLLAEKMMGHPVVEFTSHWQDRGSALEIDAVNFYELQRNLDTTKVGFVTNDDGTIGASPDRLVNDDGLLEIKVPAEYTHVSYLLKKSVDAAYYPQVMGQLWITQRQWVDVLSFHPEMVPALIRVERDEKYIDKLSAAVTTFSLELERMTEELRKRGWITEPYEKAQSWSQQDTIKAVKEALRAG